MEPAAAEIKRMPGHVNRVCAAPDPLRGFQQQGGNALGCEPPRCGYTGRPSADDDDVPISAHTICPFDKIVLRYSSSTWSVYGEAEQRTASVNFCHHLCGDALTLPPIS